MLHKFVYKALPNIHEYRRNALMCSVESLLGQGKLTLTALGRHMEGGALVKHKIKRMDRLLCNEKLNSEKFYIYKQLSHHLLKDLKEIVVLVDWSGCCSQQRWIFQASLAMSGRSIPLYQEIHPVEKLSNPKVEKEFLYKLNNLMPKNSKVTLITNE